MLKMHIHPVSLVMPLAKKERKKKEYTPTQKTVFIFL